MPGDPSREDPRAELASRSRQELTPAAWREILAQVPLQHLVRSTRERLTENLPLFHPDERATEAHRAIKALRALDLPGWG